MSKFPIFGSVNGYSSRANGRMDHIVSIQDLKELLQKDFFGIGIGEGGVMMLKNDCRIYDGPESLTTYTNLPLGKMFGTNNSLTFTYSDSASADSELIFLSNKTQ